MQEIQLVHMINPGNAYKKDFPTNIQYNRNGSSIIAHMLGDQVYIFNLKETNEESIIPLNTKHPESDTKRGQYFFSKVYNNTNYFHVF